MQRDALRALLAEMMDWMELLMKQTTSNTIHHRPLVAGSSVPDSPRPELPPDLLMTSLFRTVVGCLVRRLIPRRFRRPGRPAEKKWHVLRCLSTRYRRRGADGVLTNGRLMLPGDNVFRCKRKWGLAVFHQLSACSSCLKKGRVFACRSLGHGVFQYRSWFQVGCWHV